MSVEWNRFWCRVLFKEFIKHFRKLNDEQIVKDVRQSMDDLEDLVPDTDSFGSQMVRWSLERADEPFAVAARENGKKGGRPKKETTADGDIREDSHDRKSGTSANIYGDAATREGAEVVACRESGVVAPTTISNNMRRVPQNEAPAHGFSGGRTAQGTMSRSPEAAAQSGKDYDQETCQVSTNEARQSQRRAGADSVRGTPLHSAPARSSGPMPEDVNAVYDFAAAEGLDTADAYECWNVTVNERDGKTADGKKVTNWKAYVRKWCATRKNNRRTA